MTVLTPALSSEEREKRSPRLGNVVRRDWPDELPTDRNLATVCPLLGERKQVREDVRQIDRVVIGKYFTPCGAVKKRRRAAAPQDAKRLRRLANRAQRLGQR